jgi:hypothetical protein
MIEINLAENKILLFFPPRGNFEKTPDEQV